MGILDNDTVIVDAILTKLGRDKLRTGQPLGIKQFAFGDTGVDYTLYNPDHPSGSDSYGSAITSLPMLEAVPDDDVFLRSKLYGSGERGIQNFGYISVPGGTSRVIYHITDGTQSTAIDIQPQVYSGGSEINSGPFRFTVFDMRGLVATMGNQTVQGAAYGSSTVDKRSVTGQKLTLNAQAGQFKVQQDRIVLIELDQGGAAPIQVTATVQANTDTQSGGIGNEQS